MGTQTIPINAAANAASPVLEQLVNLASGNTTFAVPASGTTTRLTVIPPSGNTTLITLKGVNGDTGVALHKTDPTSIALDATFASLVLNAALLINGVRLIWS
jgi:hypothetical protein